MGVAKGPPGHWLLGNLLEQRRDPIAMLMRGMHDYGDVVRYRFGPYRALQLNEPAAIKHVLSDNARNYVKWGALERTAPLLGRGVFLAEGDRHRRLRRLYRPAFQRSELRGYVQHAVRATEAFVAYLRGLPADTDVDMTAAFMSLTLSIVSRSLMSTDIGGFGGGGDREALGRRFDFLVHEVGERTLSLNPLAGRLPAPRNLWFRYQLHKLERRVFALIRERRQGPSRSDFLQRLMEAEDPEGGGRLDDTELRDEILNILLTGRGPSGNNLIWLWALLDRHPEVVERMRAEAREVLGDRSPTWEDLEGLHYIERVYRESLRLYPPAWMIARQAVGPDRMAGVPVAPGTVILVSTYVVHRNPALWDDPERFDPERFTPEHVRSRAKGAYIPYGVGPRLCVGASFAAVEAKIAISMLLRDLAFQSRGTASLEPAARITLRPRHPLRMRVSPAPASAAPRTSAG